MCVDVHLSIFFKMICNWSRSELQTKLKNLFAFYLAVGSRLPINPQRVVGALAVVVTKAH